VQFRSELSIAPRQSQRIDRQVAFFLVYFHFKPVFEQSAQHDSHLLYRRVGIRRGRDIESLRGDPVWGVHQFTRLNLIGKDEWVLLSFHPCLSYWFRRRCAARSLRSMGITPLRCYYGPGRHRLACRRFPGCAGYTTALLHRFLAGARTASPVAQHVLVTVLSLTTPPECHAASVSFASHHVAFAPKEGARPPDLFFVEATTGFTFVTAW
jgi:hypothetical protein